jgi:hypothetical protein
MVHSSNRGILYSRFANTEWLNQYSALKMFWSLPSS